VYSRVSTHTARKSSASRPNRRRVDVGVGVGVGVGVDARRRAGTLGDLARDDAREDVARARERDLARAGDLDARRGGISIERSSVGVERARV